MLLSFSQEFPWEQPTNFKQKIQGYQLWSPPKIHTFRTGKRFKPGTKIHFWMGSPRIKHLFDWIDPFNLPLEEKYNWWRNPKFFDSEEAFAEYRRVMRGTEQPHNKTVPLCTATEDWLMDFTGNDEHLVYVLHIGDKTWVGDVAHIMDKQRASYIDCKWPDHTFLYEVARNDGFEENEEYEPVEFIRWFYLAAKRKNTTKLTGQLTHWTDPEQSCYDLKNAKVFTP